MTVRSIGKFGFLLAIMGFFMPVACDKNAFQLIEYVDTTSTVLIIGLFTLAIIGFIVCLLLLAKTDIPAGVDWVIILACVGMGIGLLSMNELELQYGAYVIISGFSVVLFFQFISIFTDNSSNSYNRSRYSSNKKCRQCGIIYSGSNSSCPKCNYSLYEETNQSIDASISPIAPINKNYGDAWTCKKCNETNPVIASTCKGCGEYK
jgi:ribosomal protein L40E